MSAPERDNAGELTLVVPAAYDAELRAMARITAAMTNGEDPISGAARERIARWVSDRWAAPASST